MPKMPSEAEAIRECLEHVDRIDQSLNRAKNSLSAAEAIIKTLLDSLAVSPDGDKESARRD